MPQKVFEPIYPNPYIAGNPVRGKDMFFGRQDEFHFIARALEDGNKTALIVLFGERRSGKSSILYQVLNGELGEAFLPFFVDMQIMAGIANETEFFYRIIADACKTLKNKTLSAESYSRLFEQSAATDVFRDFLQNVKSHFPNRSLLILIDEYEILEAKINEGSLSPHILTFFAGLLETELVSFVFTGSKSLETQNQRLWGEELLRKATSRKISFLTKDDTARLITQPLQDKVQYTPEVIDEIYTLTAGQPFYTQMICQNLVYHLNEVKKNTVESDDLHTVVDSIIENPPPQLIFNWNELTSERKLTLSLLAEMADTPQKYLSVRDLCRGIKRKKLAVDLDENFFHSEFTGLMQDEYVLETARRYAFRLDLYRRWVRHDHNIWQVKKEIGAQEMERITNPAHVKKERHRKAILVLERVLVGALAVLVVYFVIQLFFEKQKKVVLQANGGPFWVVVDGDTVGNTGGQADSTRFEIPELLKDLSYQIEAVLQASGEQWADSVLIEKDDQEVSFDFSIYPFTIQSDAASMEIRFGGLEEKTEENEPASWQKFFEVCAGRYFLTVKDRNTGEEISREIAVPDNGDLIQIDFERVVMLTLKSNIDQFEYSYEWRDENNKIKRVESRRADSIIVMLPGQSKGLYNFVFANPGTGEEITVERQVRSAETISILFDPNWKKPAPTITKQETTQPVSPKPIIITYTLQLDTEPQGATVFWKGDSVGLTPYSNNQLTRDYYSFTLRKAGYDPKTVGVSLRSDTTLTELLNQQYGTIQIIVQDEKGMRQPSVKVYLDGGYIGSTNLPEFELPVAEHKFTFDNGFVRRDSVFTIEKDTTKQLLIKLPTGRK